MIPCRMSRDPEYVESESYETEDGTTYVTNNYYNTDDYYYATRIRRFYDPFYSVGYYDSWYCDPYWYSPGWSFGFGYRLSLLIFWFFLRISLLLPITRYHSLLWGYNDWYYPYYGGYYGYHHGYYDGYYGYNGYYEWILFRSQAGLLRAPENH